MKNMNMKSVEKNVFLTIQYHLYQHPLYECSQKEERDLNVLMIGFGSNGHCFLDACLQNGQIRNKTLNVTAFFEDAGEKELYLSERPELGDFFSIDENRIKENDTYGNIIFKKLDLDHDKVISDVEERIEILLRLDGKQHFHYVFIDVGEDEINHALAKACKKEKERTGTDCLVTYIFGQEITAAHNEDGIYPLSIRGGSGDSSLDQEIERMAFNTHLVWEKNLNVDYKKIRKKYKEAYFHDSCVSNVLALKSNLYSMGIDLGKTGCLDAARRFNEIISGVGNSKIRDELIWIEHRRWVTEKLCLGWRRIKDLEDCADGITKDGKHKRHVCIVRSRADQMLAEEFCEDGNLEKWDNASDQELSRLDELDRMSVDLHRMYARKAKEAKKENLLDGNIISGIRSLIEDDKKVLVAFQEWHACLKNIWHGDIGKVRLYKGLKNEFLNAAQKRLPKRKAKSVKDQVRAFESVFDSVRLSTEYRDWKQDDVALIDNIPFVLTYTTESYLVIPFTACVERGISELFMNVSAPTVVSPKRIIYLYHAEENRDIQNLKESIPYVVGYMNKKKFKAAVDFVIIYPEKMTSLINENHEKELQRLGNSRIHEVKRILLNESEGDDGELTELKNYLNRRSAGKTLFALEKNGTGFSKMLLGAGFYRTFAWYKFDSKTMQFTSAKNCEMLHYICNKGYSGNKTVSYRIPYITVSDMTAIRLSSGENSRPPEFFADYQELWGRYRKDTDLWKLVCGVLSKHANENDTLSSFDKKNENKKESLNIYNFIIPFMCSRNAEKIIQLLKKHKILEAESCVRGCTSDSCEVVIADRSDYQTRYKKLFSNIYALMVPGAITCHYDNKAHRVKVVFDNLEVRGLTVTGNRSADIINMMRYFEEKKLIINLNIENNSVISFTYATWQIKELLTTAGKMLEVYVYHKIKELGDFDDVVSGYEIDWEGKDMKSELDCILTKGFQSLFIECKARPDLDQGFYFKLASLAKQFGINPTAVIIADTQGNKAGDYKDTNAIQIDRGEMMNVVTIWKPKEIDDIGQTLLKVAEGER